MPPLTTIKIAADTRLGYRIINESDFDPDVHVKFGQKPKEEPPADPPPKEPPADVVLRNQDGEEIDGDEEVPTVSEPEEPQIFEKAGFDPKAILKDSAADALVAAGLGGARQVYLASVDELVAVKGIGKRLAEALKAEAERFIELE